MPLYLRIQWGWPLGGGQLEVAAVFSDIVFLNCFVYGIPWESPGDGATLARRSSLLLPESCSSPNHPSPEMCF